MPRSSLGAAVLAATLAGAAAADEPPGTIDATMDGEPRRWLVAAAGFTESGNVVHVTVSGRPDPGVPATAGAIRLDLALTFVRGDAARQFGTGPVLVTAQDIHYVSAGAAARYSTAFGGTVSVTLDDVARDGDRVRIAGRFDARLARVGAAGAPIAIEGRFDAQVERSGG